MLRLDSSSLQAMGIEPTATASPFSAPELEEWRALFPGVENTVHLANCSQGPQSRRVREAVLAYLDNWLTVGMDWDGWVQEVNKAKAAFARLINCRPEDVGVVGSVSDAISTVASAFDYSLGRNKVLVSEAEFPTVSYVWLAHEKYGAKVEFVPFAEDGIRLEDYEHMTDDNLLIASVTHVNYQTGYKQDLNAIADIIHSKGGLLLADAYQSLGTCPLDVKKTPVDMLTSGALKYLLGTPGIAFLYIRPEVVERMRPSETGWFGQENPFSLDMKRLDYAKSGRRAESGTPPVIAAYPARAGMELILDVGLDKIGQQIDYLSAYTLRGAIQRGLDLASPLRVGQKGAATAIRVPGDPHDLELELKGKGIITASRGPVIRIAPHFFNTEEEIDRALDEIAAIVG